MKRRIAAGLFGLIVAVSAAGCSENSSTEPPSTTPAATSTTTSEATAAESTTTVDAPAPEADTASPDTQATEPAAPTDPTSGVTGEALYQQTCTQFLPSIDALEQTGMSDRATSVEGLRNEMTNSPSWSSVPPSDQNEILRGLDAAGAGQC